MITIGRPGRFAEWLTPDGLLRIEGWARDGLTDKQIAINMGISERSFTDWKDRFPAITAALKKGKQPVDLEVENALLKRAMGYDYEETVTEIYKGADGQERQHIRRHKKHMPADVTAQIYWLNNRRPERWRNRKAAETEQPNVALEKAREILGGVKSAID